MATNKKSLFVLSMEYRELAERIAEAMATAEDEDTVQMLNDTLEAEAYPLEQKVAAVAFIESQEQALMKAIKDDIDRQKERLETLTKHSEARMKYLLECMKIAKADKIETANCSVSVRTSKSVEIADDTLVPDEYIKVDVVEKLDKIAIRNALNAGKDVPGCSIKTNERIQIK